MRRIFLIALMAMAGFAVMPPGLASAHSIDKASLGCGPNGASQVTLTVSNFTPINGHRETITATFTNGTVEQFVPPFDAGTFTEPGPTVPNGTKLGVKLVWPEGSLTVPPVTLSCQPPPPPPPSTALSCSGLTFNYAGFPTTPVTFTLKWSTGETTTFTTTGASGTATQPLPSIPPNGTVETVTGTATIYGLPFTFTASATLSCHAPTPPPPSPPGPTPPGPTPPGPTPPGPTPPGPTPPKPPVVHRCVEATRTVYLNNQDPRTADAAKAKCLGIPAKEISVTVGPQGLTKGIATLRGRVSKAIHDVRWTVTIHGFYGQETFTKVFREHNLTFPMDVTSKKLFGTSGKGWTYGPHDKIVVTMTGRT